MSRLRPAHPRPTHGRDAALRSHGNREDRASPGRQLCGRQVLISGMHTTRSRPDSRSRRLGLLVCTLRLCLRLCLRFGVGKSWTDHTAHGAERQKLMVPIHVGDHVEQLRLGVRQNLALSVHPCPRGQHPPSSRVELRAPFIGASRAGTNRSGAAAKAAKGGEPAGAPSVARGQTRLKLKLKLRVWVRVRVRAGPQPWARPQSQHRPVGRPDWDLRRHGWWGSWSSSSRGTAEQKVEQAAQPAGPAW